MPVSEHKQDSDSADLAENGAGTVLSPLARRYYAIAVQSYFGATSASLDNESEHAVITIFFALAALEAYLPELDSLGRAVAFRQPLDRDAVRAARRVRERKRENEIERAFAAPTPKRQPESSGSENCAV